MSKLSLNQLRITLGAAVRDTNYNVLYNWLLRFKSKPLEVSKKSAIVFSPHQDDETIGCGGAIALKRSQGIPVKVVFLTDGRYGRPDWIEPENIIGYRQQEANSALNILGVEPSQTQFLGVADGTLTQLSAEQRNLLIAKLVEIIQSFAPQEVYVPHHDDGHPDHEATYSLVSSAIKASKMPIELLQYPIWMLWRSPLSTHKYLQKQSKAYRLFIGDSQEKKQQAIAIYKSQTPNLPSSLKQAASSPYEMFFKD
ncbi:PIG-L deacetylase family protein [Rivularia sp. UHCC 0363]|uniref:PIG-L deacetylase family protein n=1 Tax=Rivularia sp. UHCC 0363 TaxID=3110244 RepID=UPI002B220D65|nr:PIG-L deacetylase family protein [Rivularia sp. UHCC 0363]MEA5597604.1 PIG-L deacetylase family protein [Rivularia sp. UHCC 0363]